MSKFMEMKSHGERDSSSVDAIQERIENMSIGKSINKQEPIPSYEIIDRAFDNPITSNCETRGKDSRAIMPIDKEGDAEDLFLNMKSKSMKIRQLYSYSETCRITDYDNVPTRLRKMASYLETFPFTIHQRGLIKMKSDGTDPMFMRKNLSSQRTQIDIQKVFQNMKMYQSRRTRLEVSRSIKKKYLEDTSK